MLIAGIAIVIGGAALAVVGFIARAGRLDRQSVVGLRTRATTASDEAWAAAHDAGASWVVVAGAILAAGGILVMVADSETTAGAIALIAAWVMMIPLVIAFRKGQAAARSV